MSNLSPSVLSARQRALLYRDANGIAELVLGLALVVFGSRDYFKSLLAPFGALGRVLVVLAILFAWGVMMLGNKRIVEWLKIRLVYPRTGYVAAPDEADRIGASQEGSPYVFMGLGVLITLVFVASNFIIRARWISSTAILLLFISYGFASGQFKLAPLRNLLFSIPLVTGLAWWTFAKPIPSFNALFTVLGGSLAIAGAIRLSLYLHRNPQPSSTAP